MNDGLKKLYVLYCSQLNNCTSRKEVKRHNSAMKKLGELYKIVVEEPNKSFLLELLQNNNDRVRVIAAAHCLGLNEYVEEAQEALSDVAINSNNQFISFEAKSTLDVWKQQGYLKF